MEHDGAEPCKKPSDNRRAHHPSEAEDAHHSTRARPQWPAPVREIRPFRSPPYFRGSAKSRLSASRRDVLVRREKVFGIPRGLDVYEARVVRTVCRPDALVALLFGEEVDVSAASGELADVVPDGPYPLDIDGVVFWPLPRSEDVEDGLRIPINHGGVMPGQRVEGAINREDEYR